MSIWQTWKVGIIDKPGRSWRRGHDEMLVCDGQRNLLIELCVSFFEFVIAMFKRTSSARIDRKPSHKAANTVLPPYPTDGIPGARDVASEYGSTRLYEWGPENGQRVLFIHGLSTPAPALAALAMTLSRKGCHVMIIGESHRSS
jgi:hypothetical protein